MLGADCNAFSIDFRAPVAYFLNSIAPTLKEQQRHCALGVSVIRREQLLSEGTVVNVKEQVLLYSLLVRALYFCISCHAQGSDRNFGVCFGCA